MGEVYKALLRACWNKSEQALRSTFLVLILLSAFGITSCITIRRSTDRDQDRVPASIPAPIQYEESPSRARLKELERDVIGRREREQYFRAKPYMVTLRERIEFLKLPTFEEREEWLERKGYIGSVVKYPTDVQDLIDRNDIATGMTKSAVRESWGEPDHVEVAGNPIYGNEHWYYREQISTGEGYKTVNRKVFFEEGVVIGWESR